jgi:hypothetical protein
MRHPFDGPLEGLADRTIWCECKASVCSDRTRKKVLKPEVSVITMAVDVSRFGGTSNFQQ